MKRSSLLALVLAGLSVLCVLVGCMGVAAVGPGLLFGCKTDPTPAVPTVQDDPRRVASLFPRLRLEEARSVRWQIRESRPRTCPAVAPISYMYDGLIALSADPPGVAWQPAAPPAIPRGLSELAPAGAQWRTSADFDAATGGSFWLDAGSHTLYFHRFS